MHSVLKIPFLIIALVVMGGINLMYLEPEPSLLDHLPELKVNANKIYRDFRNNEASARELYLDKVIEVSGLLRSVEKTKAGKYVLILDFESSMGRLRCELDEADYPDLDKLKIGEAITLKGFGRDYLFEVVMDHSVIVQHP